MAPIPRDFDPDAPSLAFRDEWTNPSNYAFTILLLLGGDVVGRALAQLVGGWVTPVAFSFGWVSYATSAINSAVGENKLMPGADTPCCLINGENGNVRGNGSWILGRMMRDYHHWMPHAVRVKTEEVVERGWDFIQKREKDTPPDLRTRREDVTQVGLIISFWKPDNTKPTKRPGRDLLFWSGIVVTILQLGIAAIPCGTNGDWGVLLVTGAAIILCFLTGSLRQWRVEKWACRELKGDKKRMYVLTRGNGSQHAIAIICDGEGLNLEDLATGFENLDNPQITPFARFAVVVLGILWILLLITSSALVTEAWFLIAIGGIGMLQNMFVAGWSRKPAALGVPLKFEGVIGESKVLDALLAVERRHKKLGKSMLGTFFPNGIRENEQKEWDIIAEQHKSNEEKKLLRE